MHSFWRWQTLIFDGTLSFNGGSLTVFSSDDVCSLRVGFQEVDGAFRGLKMGEFSVIHGSLAHFISMLLCVRAQLPISDGGLNSPVLFVDGGNSFNPYLVAELSRSHGVDARATLQNIYVSRAFTAYQLSTLILNDLEKFQEHKKAKAVIVSDIASLYLDRDVPKGDAERLFRMVCRKLLEVAGRRVVVAATYFPGGRCERGLLLEALLFACANSILRFDSSGSVVRFCLERHPELSPFTLKFSTVYPTIMEYVEV
jgi:hypothetical protein